MKILYSVLFILFLFSCSQKEEPVEETRTKKWINHPISFNEIVEQVNEYHMFDSTNTKVGSMILGQFFKNGLLVMEDTSLFDDGSVYETARFKIDTSKMVMNAVNINIKMGKTELDVALTANDKDVKGEYKIKRDTTANVHKIDSIYNYDIIRGEIYTLLHALEVDENDTLSLNVLAPTTMQLSKATLVRVGSEKITVPAGTFDCDVIWLKTDGKMPTNKIWVKKESPRKLVKFYVPGLELTIELKSGNIQ